MRSQFDRQLEMLHYEMHIMGKLCETAINNCTAALLVGDIEKAVNMGELSNQITNQERYIENICVKMLMQQQPVARDLRTISAALKMVTDMKRIGDQSCDIADIISVGNVSSHTSTAGFGPMTAQVIKMVNRSVESFVKQDMKLASSVLTMDDIVDNCFIEIRRELLEGLKADTPEYSDETALDLLMIDKYLERIADHAVNVAQWVIFSKTGEIKVES